MKEKFLIEGDAKDIQSMKLYSGLMLLSYLAPPIVIFIIEAVTSFDPTSFAIGIYAASIVVAAQLTCSLFDRRFQRPMFFQEYKRLLYGVLCLIPLLYLAGGVLLFLIYSMITRGFLDSPTVIIIIMIIVKAPAAFFTHIFFDVGLFLLTVWLILRLSIKAYWKNTLT